MHNANDFLNIDEAAQLVGLSHWTIRRWLEAGKLTRYKSASRTLVRRTELLDLTKVTATTAHIRERGSANSNR
jgi:excisionase family DNA binding protein